MPRYAARVDVNHATVRDELRDVYGKDNVIDMSTAGQHVPGFPDLLIAVGQLSMNPMPPAPDERGHVGGRGIWVLIEIKRPGEKLNENQQEWIWRAAGPVIVAETAEQAVEAIQALRGSA